MQRLQPGFTRTKDDHHFQVPLPLNPEHPQHSPRSGPQPLVHFRIPSHLLHAVPFRPNALNEKLLAIAFKANNRSRSESAKY